MQSIRRNTNFGSVYVEKPEREAYVVTGLFTLLALIPFIIIFISTSKVGHESNYNVAPSYKSGVKERVKKEKMAIQEQSKGSNDADALKSAAGISRKINYFPVRTKDNLKDPFLTYGVQKVGFSIPYQTKLKGDVPNTFLSTTDSSDFWDNQTNSQFKKIKNGIKVNKSDKGVDKEVNDIINNGQSKDKQSGNQSQDDQSQDNQSSEQQSDNQ